MVAYVLIPLYFPDDCVHLIGSVPQSVKSTDDGAHAGAGNAVDGNALFLHHLEYSYVCGTLGTSSREGETYLRVEIGGSAQCSCEKAG